MKLLAKLGILALAAFYGTVIAFWLFGYLTASAATVYSQTSQSSSNTCTVTPLLSTTCSVSLGVAAAANDFNNGDVTFSVTAPVYGYFDHTYTFVLYDDTTAQAITASNNFQGTGSQQDHIAETLFGSNEGGKFIIGNSYSFRILSVWADSYSVSFPSDGGGAMYLIVNDSGGTSPSYTPTHIVSFAVSTTTSTVHEHFYLNSTSTEPVTITNTISSPLFAQLYGDSFVATTTGDVYHSYGYPEPTTTYGTSTAGFNRYTFYADLRNHAICQGGGFAFCDTIIEATSTTLSLDQFDATINIANLIATSSCGILALDGCIRNALIWAFYPSDNAKNSFNTIKDQLYTKAPVGYVVQIFNALYGLTSTSSPTFSIVIPDALKTYVFDPISTGLASILWYFWAMHFYRRLKHIQL